MERFDAIVIGAGFYGCALALRLRQIGFGRVLVIEREREILTRASRRNQARVHMGYHYPRSFLTALRSRVNYARFVADFADCIDDSFAHYYAIARVRSNVSARQFEMFASRIGAPLRAASAEVRTWFDADLIEDVFAVEECVFDPVALASRLRAELEAAQVSLSLESEAQRVTRDMRDGGGLIVESTGTPVAATAEWVFQCTYARLNTLLATSGLPRVALRHELAELALVEVPEPLRGVGLTVMCGPFFSLLPYPPARGLHTLSHVRYTPRQSLEAGSALDPYAALEPLAETSHFRHMQQDARRYVPLLADCRQHGSLWEAKTVLPQCEIDDARPILCAPVPECPRLINVVGSKIDNVYDVLDTVEGLVASASRAR